jgi:shikimate kinase
VENFLLPADKSHIFKNETNIILIGMPGAGKSTAGVILAKLTSLDFVDTDLLIQLSQRRSLQEIVDTDGHMALRRIEEDIILGLDCENHVIATGGSAIYSYAAMAYLKSKGIAVFLDVPLHILQSRIHDFETRGLARRPDQTLSDLYLERFALYTKYADVRVDCSEVNQEDVCAMIIKELEIRKHRSL